MAMQKLKEAAELAKISLSDSAEAVLRVPGISQDYVIQLERFLVLTQHLQDRLWLPLKQMGEETFLAWAAR